VATARECGCTGTIIMRMISASYGAGSSPRSGGVGTRFSVTVPVNASVRAAIAAIGKAAWTGHALRSDCSPSTTLSTPPAP
jgi:hypothetical protein